MAQAGIVAALATVATCFAQVVDISKITDQLENVHPMWLRERCREDFHVNVETRQPKSNLHDVDADLSVKRVKYVEKEDSFKVTFSDGKDCSFHSKSIQAELGNEVTFLQTDDWKFPPLFTWDKTLGAPTTFGQDEITNYNVTTLKFLSAILSTGITVIDDVPTGEGECARFVSRFSSVRDTSNLGKSFSYESVGMHTDAPYMADVPPAFKLLHSSDNAQNKFVDGFAVADALCKLNPDYFDILTKVPLRWENNGEDDSSLLYRYAPVLEVVPSAATKDEKCRALQSINFSTESGGYAPLLPSDQANLFYKAKYKFSELLNSPDFTVEVGLSAGSLVFIDNHRVLHSTSKSEAVDTCYMNREGISFLYEKLRRKFATISATPFRNLKEAQKADYDRMGDEYDEAVAEKTIANLVEILESQKPHLLGARVSLYEHNLQTASRAWRAGEDEETVVISLFHDMFETLAVKNHGDLIADMLAPWISPKSHWMLANHEVFQGHYYFDYYGMDKNRRDMYKDEPYYNATVYWCEHYDQASFDPDYPSLPLSHFMPMVERIFARQQYWWNPDHPKAGAVTKSQA